MDFNLLQHVCITSPVIKLIRSHYAPLIIGFLFDAFKKTHRISIPSPELVELLEDYLDRTRHLFQPKSLDLDVSEITAKAFLGRWCDEEHGYLRKYDDDVGDDALFELTPETETVIEYFTQITADQEFVGTESRFIYIFQLLREIAQNSEKSPEARLALLEQQKEKINEQIRLLRETRVVETLDITQIRERFLRANEEARKLLADFRMVERNFRDTSRSIHEHRYLKSSTKGDIVGEVLDSSDELRNSDQGKSFYSFRRFLVSTDRQRELEDLLELVYSLTDIQYDVDHASTLRDIKIHLKNASRQVDKSFNRLSDQLRRLLDDSTQTENREVTKVTDDIKKLAHKIKSTPPKMQDFLIVDDSATIFLPIERPLWSPPTRFRFTEEELAHSNKEFDPLAWAPLINQNSINLEQLRSRIRFFLKGKTTLTLSELIKCAPIENGLEELVAYYVIADKNSKYLIKSEIRDDISIRSINESCIRHFEVNVPRIIFQL